MCPSVFSSISFELGGAAEVIITTLIFQIPTMLLITYCTIDFTYTGYTLTSTTFYFLFLFDYFKSLFAVDIDLFKLYLGNELNIMLKLSLVFPSVVI